MIEEIVGWKCHTPNLLTETLKNPSTGVLRVPFNIFGKLLYAVAKRASELNDPELNLLMLRLTLYEAGDPAKHSAAEIEATFETQRRAMAEQERK